MKTIRMLGLCCAFSGIAVGHAQQSANASGGDASGSGGSVSYSVGQVVYTTASGAGGMANQGVQQPFEFFVTGIDEFPQIQLEMLAYPNPTRSTLNLKIDGEHMSGLYFELYSVSGQLVSMARIEDVVTEIPMEMLAAGSYMLRVLNADVALKTFSILKTN